MSGPILGGVVLNLAARGVADPAERLERVYQWRVTRTTLWLKALLAGIAVVVAPLVIDVATPDDSIDGTGRFFLAVAAVALAGSVVGVWIRLERLEAEYATAQALLAAVRTPPRGRPAGQPAPPRPPGPPASPPPPGPAVLRDVTGSD